MSSSQVDRRSLLGGSGAGIGAWVLGYLFTYLIVAPDVRNSLGSRVIELFEGSPATFEIVGWVFYNAHLVQTVLADVPVLGASSDTFIGGDPGFTPWLYVVPVGLLLAAGLAAGRLHGASDTGEGIVAGLTVVPAYLLLTIAGVILFSIDLAGGTVSPDLVSAVLLAGVVYPAVCGAVGGALAGVLPS